MSGWVALISHVCLNDSLELPLPGIYDVVYGNKRVQLSPHESPDGTI